MDIKISVILPTYNQCAFVRRAIISVMKQSHREWELIIVNDGSTDETEYFLADFLGDKRITYIKNEENTGLGHALNQGLAAARFDYIAYLPSDDFYFENHLEVLLDNLVNNKAFLSFSGMQFDTSDSLRHVEDLKTEFNLSGRTIQLVQALHKKSSERWTERSEWIGDDLYSMYWQKISKHGIFVPTLKVTCFWTQHPNQRHKIINEKYGGGLNKIRSHYRIKHPIRLRVSKEKFIDENIQYQLFRKENIVSEDGLKILMVGELAYNPERIYAFEEAGHQLYGLWMPHPTLSFNTIGPLPFGHVTDVSRDNWKEEVSKIKPDIIYCLLNWGAIDWCHEVVTAFPDIPYAWHYKEGPQLSIRLGSFDKLISLYTHADLRVYINKMTKSWFEQFIPNKGLSFVMDGDLPKSNYFSQEYTHKLSEDDNCIHILVAGRLIGMTIEDLEKFSKNRVKVHLYLENFHELNSTEMKRYKELYSDTFYLHTHCPPQNWVSEFSKYDFGWLHSLPSDNNNEIMRSSWDDLNYPARISTYMAAGLPLLQKNTANNASAVSSLIEDMQIGYIFTDMDDLIQKISDKQQNEVLKVNVMHHREKFSFDYYVPELVNLFYSLKNKLHEK